MEWLVCKGSSSLWIIRCNSKGSNRCKGSNISKGLIKISHNRLYKKLNNNKVHNNNNHKRQMHLNKNNNN